MGIFVYVELLFLFIVSYVFIFNFILFLYKLFMVILLHFLSDHFTGQYT